MSKQAVHFGAGNIGRGFLGQLYFESGFSTTFIDVAEDVVRALRERGRYPLHLVDEHTDKREISNVTAINARDAAAVAQAIAEADIVSTAVGVPVLKHVAPPLAQGIELRLRQPNPSPLNVLVCENLLDAGPYLRGQVLDLLSSDIHPLVHAHIGFVNASIGRMVPVMTEAQKAEDPLLVCVEPYCELPVDAEGFRGPIPVIAHMKPLQHFDAYVERKLFIHNMAHAAVSYLGYLRGHEFVWQGIRDANVRPLVEAAMTESSEGLARKHGQDRSELRAHVADLIHRFHNRALNDRIDRVGRDPIRKLGRRDRLIGAMEMCLAQEVRPEAIAVAAAAAMLYDPADDPAAQTIQRLREENGLAGVLREICGIEDASPIHQLVADASHRLQQEGWTTQR